MKSRVTTKRKFTVLTKDETVLCTYRIILNQ